MIDPVDSYPLANSLHGVAFVKAEPDVYLTV